MCTDEILAAYPELEKEDIVQASIRKQQKSFGTGSQASNNCPGGYFLWPGAWSGHTEIARKSHIKNNARVILIQACALFAHMSPFLSYVASKKEKGGRKR